MKLIHISVAILSCALLYYLFCTPSKALTEKSEPSKPVEVLAKRIGALASPTMGGSSSGALRYLNAGQGAGYFTRMDVATSYCASYLSDLNHPNSNSATSPKVKSWCAGLESVARLGQKSRAFVDSNSSVVQAGVTELYAEGKARGQGDKALGFLRMSLSPQDYASAAQALDRFYPSKLWTEGQIERGSVSDPEMLARFSGLLAGCRLNYCGPSSTATLDVCAWPGFVCSSNTNFEQALSDNFSKTDIQRLDVLSRKLIALSGH